MALLIVGGIGYALLIMFILGAMMLSGRASDREARRLQPVQVRTAVAGNERQLPLSLSNMSGRDAA